jgi:hypothetical protein
MANYTVSLEKCQGGIAKDLAKIFLIFSNWIATPPNQKTHHSKPASIENFT